MKVYIAMALSESATARDWALRFANEYDIQVTSEWHDTDAKGDPISKDVRRDVFRENIEDLREADVLFLQTATGEPSCTYVELGYALAMGKDVVWLQPAGRRSDGKRYSNISDSAHGVRVLVEDADVIPTMLRLNMARRDTDVDLEGAG